MKKNKKALKRLWILLITSVVAVLACICICVILLLNPVKKDSSSNGRVNQAITVPSVVIMTEATTSTSKSNVESISVIQPVPSSLAETTEVISSEATTEATTEAATEAITEAITEPESVAVNHLVFVGDSRYVGMAAHNTGEDIFFCEVGVGYLYIEEHYSEIVNACTADSALVLGMGVNDCSDPALINYYIDLINRLRADVKVRIFLQLLAPVDAQAQIDFPYKWIIYPEEVNTYNQILVNTFQNTELTIISLDDFLTTNGIAMADGLHYSSSSYLSIYGYLKSTVYSML